MNQLQGITFDPLFGTHHRRPCGGGIAWPTFQGTAQLVGSTVDGRASIYVDTSMPDPGQQNAHDLLADAPRIMAGNDAIFGQPSGHVDVIVFALGGQTDGTGGADHASCNYQTGNAIEVDASFGNSMRCSALMEAEVSECSMGGNLCGMSTGEALSRWCAAAVGNNALADYATAPYWFKHGMPNWVDKTDPTDRDPISTGCGMAFISWLIEQGHPLPNVAQTMVGLGDGGTLARAYEKLTGNQASAAWSGFTDAIKQLGTAVTSDDPFGALTPVAIASMRKVLAAGMVMVVRDQHSRSLRLLPPTW